MKKYRKVNIAGREREREGGKRTEGRKKRNGKITLCIGAYAQGSGCVLHRARRGRGNGDDVGGSSRIDRVWAATNPRLSLPPPSLSLCLSLWFRRSVPPLFASLFYASGAFLSSSSIRLPSFRLAFFVSLAPFLSSVLSAVARLSFLHLLHRFGSHALFPPLFFSLPLPLSHFTSPCSPPFRDIRPNIEPGCPRRYFPPDATGVLVDFLLRLRVLEFLGQSRRGCNSHPLTLQR